MSGKVWLLLTLPQTNGIYNWGKSAPRAAKVIVIKIFLPSLEWMIGAAAGPSGAGAPRSLLAALRRGPGGRGAPGAELVPPAGGGAELAHAHGVARSPRGRAKRGGGGSSTGAGGRGEGERKGQRGARAVSGSPPGPGSAPLLCVISLDSSLIR